MRRLIGSSAAGLAAACILSAPGALAQERPEYAQSPFFYFDDFDGLTADIALADVDGDGDLDALVANGRHWAQQDYVFLNAGEGRMLEALRIGEVLGPSYALCPGDFDADGDVDVVVVRDQLPAQIMLNDGTGRFALAGELAGSGGAARAAAVADFNGDGAPDLVIARRRGADLYWLGDGAGGFAGPLEIGADGRGSTGVAAGDLDGDFDADLVIARRDGEASVIAYYDGADGFRIEPLEGSEGDHRKAVVADLDGDGVPEIVLAGVEGTHLVYRRAPDMTYYVMFDLPGAGGATQALAAADLDGDGDLDLVEGTETGNAIYWNEGVRGFLAVPLEGEADTYGVAVGDLDGDGVPDLVFANSGDANLVMMAR